MKTEIYQIYYDKSQLKELDPNFIPYNNQGKNYPFNFEYAVFFDLFQKVNWNEVDLLGTVSWKFNRKTGLSSANIFKSIQDNPGMDVYFVNPFPELVVYRNVWEHGEAFHPRITEITRKLLLECQYPDSILKIETPPNLTAYCNYWIANKSFWEKYIAFLRPIWDTVNSSNSEVVQTLSKPADQFINAPYLPFIFERLFSTFLTINKFNSAAIPISDKKLSENRFFYPIKDRLLRANSRESHSQISLGDKMIINSCYKACKYRHYYAPLVLKKIKHYVRTCSL